MAKASNHRQSQAESDGLGSNTRGIISLVLFVYLFCMWVVLSSVLGGPFSSPLQGKLLGFFGRVTQPLNLEVQSLPYYLFSGLSNDYEHFFRVEVAGPSGDISMHQVPGPELGSGLRDAQRYRRLAAIASLEAELGGDAVPAEVASGIGQYFLRSAGGGKVTVTCIRREPQPRDLELDGRIYLEDATDPSYETEMYTAVVLLDDQGSIQVIKQMAAEHVAPVQ